MVQQPHARKARLGDLRRADCVIGARGFAAALRVQPRVALAEADEVGLHAVGDAEIEMPAVCELEKARSAEVVIVAEPVDISPEFARGARNIRFADQIFASLDDRRGEAEVEAEQCGLFRHALEQPCEHFLA